MGKPSQRPASVYYLAQETAFSVVSACHLHTSSIRHRMAYLGAHHHKSQCPVTPFSVIDFNAMDAQRLDAATPIQCREDPSNAWNNFCR